MSSERPASPAQQLYGDVAPKLAECSDDILYGDIWRRPQLSPRDRSLITCAALVAMGRVEQMEAHFRLALTNGVTPDELVESITHLAFYAGWPAAVSAITRAKAVLDT
jgi:4-carboxymuconolactone decarboxylase